MHPPHHRPPPALARIRPPPFILTGTHTPAPSTRTRTHHPSPPHPPAWITYPPTPACIHPVHSRPSTPACIHPPSICIHPIHSHPSALSRLLGLRGMRGCHCLRLCGKDEGIRHSVSRENHRAFFQSPCGFGIAIGRDLQGFWPVLCVPASFWTCPSSQVWDRHYITCPCHPAPALSLP